MDLSPSKTQPIRRHGNAARLAAATLAIAAATLHMNAPIVQAEMPPELLKYAGEYKYDGTKEQYLAVVDKGLEEAMSELNMVMRLMAKKAMEARTQVFVDVVTIELSGNKISIKSATLPKVSVELGKSENITSPDGKMTSKATHKFEGGKIVQTFTSDQGSMSNVYQLSADGKSLTRVFTITSPRLQKPIKITHKYTRK
jgi:hypothetical protein